MKTFRRIILSIVILVCGFVAGYCTGQDNGKSIILSQYKLLHNDYNTKTELIKAQKAALNAADKVMDNNQLFDTDGSDAMVDYLNKASVVDSLNKLEQQALAYCSCLLTLCLREHKKHLQIISRERRERCRYVDV